MSIPSVDMYFSVLCKYPGMKLLGYIVNVYLNLLEMAKLFSEVVVSFYNTTNCFTSSPTLGIVSLIF